MKVTKQSAIVLLLQLILGSLFPLLVQQNHERGSPDVADRFVGDQLVGHETWWWTASEALAGLRLGPRVRVDPQLPGTANSAFEIRQSNNHAPIVKCLPHTFYGEQSTANT